MVRENFNIFVSIFYVVMLTCINAGTSSEILQLLREKLV
jgi:hypothetical protein